MAEKPKIENKEKTLFWLRRRMVALERQHPMPTQEEMARQGIPYDQRQALIDKAEKDRDNIKHELEAFKTAIGFIEEYSV